MIQWEFSGANPVMYQCANALRHENTLKQTQRKLSLKFRTLL